MKYSVIGAGKSGIAAALLAKNNGHDVFLSELKSSDMFPKEIDTLLDNAIEFEFGNNTLERILESDTIITSPGVPPHSQVLVEAFKIGLPIISEVEFAYNFLNNPIIGVTGTNGKTTTTTLIAYMLNHAGKKAIPCGNIGTPLSSLVGKVADDDILVVELSSFQLDNIKTFKPDVAIILNITPDHLYYHGTMENYTNSKFKIAMNQDENNLLILNNDDPIIREKVLYSKPNIVWFSQSLVDWGTYNHQGRMRIRLPKQQIWEEVMLFDEIRIPGVHNHYNSMAAALAVRAFEVNNENIRDSLIAFSGVEHRLEFVRTINSVDYINDSKATNINAAWFALESFKQAIIWIAGGRGDSNDYSLLDSSVSKNVKAIIAIGEESDNIFNHFCTKKSCFRMDSLESAVYKAKELADNGEVVLFSPACKSFDMFMNFEHRGECFKSIVNVMAIEES